MRRFQQFSPRPVLAGVVALAAVAGLAALLCGAALGAPADVAATGKVAPAAAPAATPAAPPAPVASGTARTVIAIEPETGSLVPPAAGTVPLAPGEEIGLLRTSAGLVERQLAGGAVMVDLQGRFREYTVLHLDPQGQPRFACVHDKKALGAALDPCAPNPAPTAEEK